MAGPGAVVIMTADSGRIWTRFWDDRQAVRLKLLLLAACVLAAAALEAPW